MVSFHFQTNCILVTGITQDSQRISNSLDKCSGIDIVDVNKTAQVDIRARYQCSLSALLGHLKYSSRPGITVLAAQH